MNLKRSEINYKSEIDGIRAVAIIAVIINHFNKDILPSGYLGVDIFFVISGYVITSSIYKRKSKNFSKFISEFYIRRIKRLVPALIFFVLCISLLICFFRSNSSGSLNTGISSLFGLSNIALFFRSKNYFAPSEALNPFIHTWSLGVEQQFYLIFPFLVWFTGFGRHSHKGLRNLFIVISFLLFFSLILFIYLYQINQPAAYYLIFTRFWEFSAGCLLFLGFVKKNRLFKYLERINPLFILLGMIGTMFLTNNFAVLSTILIVILTLIMIISLKKEQLIFNLFNSKILNHLGLISYSLYLWHWGVLSISRWTIGIHFWSIPFQLVLIYILALFSYKFIEIPLRNKSWSIVQWKTIPKAISVLFVSAIVLFIIEKNFKEKLYLGDTKLNLIDEYYELNDKNEFCQPNQKKDINNSSNNFLRCLIKNEKNNQSLFFVGDSYTRALLNGAEIVAKKTNSNLFFYGTALPPLPKKEIVGSSDSEIHGIKKVKPYFEVNKGDVFVITIRMPGKFLKENYSSKNDIKEYFYEWLNVLEEFSIYFSKKNVSVVVSTPTPEFVFGITNACKEQNKQWFNKLNNQECYFPLKHFIIENGKYHEIIKRLKKIASRHDNLYLFDALSAMCPDDECRYSLNGQLLYRDGRHISTFAAKKLIAPQLINFIKDSRILLN